MKTLWLAALVSLSLLSACLDVEPAASTSNDEAPDVRDVESTRQSLDAVVTPLPSSAAVPAPLPAMTTTPIGRIPGRLSVSSGGAAVYAVKLEVPPGRHGIEPDLGLEYDSQKQSGLAGTGWSLTGVWSEITPCGRDLRQPEGWVQGVRWSSGDDLLCLDGEPLVHTNARLPAPLYGDAGAEYRTERDSFRKVVQNGRPATSFTVYMKDGRVLTYGGDAGRMAARSGKVRAWVLTQVADRFGNTMSTTWHRYTSSYLEDYDQNTFADYTGAPEVMEYMPASIAYAGREVTFSYASRSDKERGWQAGLRNERTRRLSSVRTYVDGRRVRTYTLGYTASPSTGASLLTSLEECSGVGDGVCKPKTTFEYSVGEQGYQPAQATQVTAPPMGLPPGGIFPATPLPLFPMDVDGDGKTDLVYPKGPANALANTAAYTWRILKVGSQGMANATELDTGVGATWPFAGIPLDYNQDGRLDLLLLDRATFWQVLVANATGTDFTLTNVNVGKSQQFIGTGEDAIDNFARFTRVADLNGDGAPDLLSCEETSGQFRWSYRFHNGTGWGSINRLAAGVAGTADCRTEAVAALLIDTDGDGATELVFSTPSNTNYQAVFFNKPAGLPLPVRDTKLPSTVPGSFSQNRLRLMDVNHDGLVDIVAGMSVPGAPTIAPTIRYWLNLGDRFSGGLHGYAAYAADFGQYSGALFTSGLIDDDGDGAHDLLLTGDPSSMTGCGGSGQPTCPPARTDGFEILRNVLVDTWPPAPKLSRYDTGVRPYCYYGRGFSRPRALDENGDLLPDLVFVDTTAGGHSQQNPCWSHPAQFMYARHKGGQPDLLVKVRDGQVGVGPSSTQWESTYTSRIVYAPATSTSVYDHVLPGETRAACAYPVSCVKPHVMLVRDTYQDTGDGNAPARTSFDYFDARVSLAGRGFLGFGQRRIVESVSGAVTTLRYDNVTFTPVEQGAAAKVRRYPFAGALTSSTRDVVNAAGQHVVTRTTLHHTALLGPTLFPYTSYAVFSAFADREEKVVTEGATELTRVVKTTSRDLFGNTTCETTDFAGSGVTCANEPALQASHNWSRVTTSFTNDASAWLIGLPIDRVTRGVAGTQSAVQHVRTAHDPATGALTTKTLEPNVGAQRLVTTYGHDGFGNVISVKEVSSSESRETQYGYDSEGVFIASTTNALGHVTRTSFDRALGVPLTTVDANGLVSQFQHDGFGRLRRVTRPDGVVTQTDYVRTDLTDARYTFTVVRDTAGGDFHSEKLDRLGRAVRVETSGFGGSPIFVDTTWNRNGKVASRTLPGVAAPSGNRVQFEYDDLERLVRTTHADGTFSRIEYRGLDVDFYDEAGVRTRRTYKERGQTKKLDAPATGELTYTYGPFGELASITNELGHATRIASDNHGRPVQIEDPSAGVRKLGYDAFGQLVEQIDAEGRSMKSSYDKLGRLVLRTDGAGDAAFTWDSAPKGIGKIASTQRGSQHLEKYEYDGAGRLAVVETFVAAADPGATLQVRRAYTYGAGGQLSREEWKTPEAAFALGYDYDGAGHLNTVRDELQGAVLWRALEANAAGQLTKEKVLTGYETVTRYHPTRGWVTGIETKPVQNLEYTYDARGNVTRRADVIAHVAQRFAYNPEQELVEVLLCGTDVVGCPSGETQQRKYEYDSIGNMVWDNELGAHTYDAQRPQLMIKAGGESYEYDANGYTRSLRGKSVEFTAFGKPSRIGSTTLFYDASDQRALKVDGDARTAYVGLLQRVRSSNGVSTQLLMRATGRTIGSITVSAASSKPVYTFFHADNQGSANVTSRFEAGLVSLEPQYTFEPFGQAQSPRWSSGYTTTLSPLVESVGYGGHDHDGEHGLIDMKGRIYDPKTGRFLSPDPVVHAPFKRQDLNRYAYAWNNPLKFSDPSGYTEDWEQEQSYDDYDDYGDEGDYEGTSYEDPSAEMTAAELAEYEGYITDSSHETVVYGSPTDQSRAGGSEGPNPDEYPDDWNLDPNGQTPACLVELCSRAADLPGGKEMAKLGLYHKWIRTPNMEVGMGKEGGGVPGREVNTDTMKTTMNDHKGEGDKLGSVCVPICGVDVEEVEGRAAEGTETGVWIPLMNDCNNVVEDTLVDSGANPNAVDMPYHPDLLRDAYEWLAGD
ncbi:MAG: hypothetical protein JNK82_41585 [Myxococcaceae bacterium]|nr:hypothetical protein [Myxococcaceae bacterium]